MNPKNVKGLMAQPEIDGGLIGGAFGWCIRFVTGFRTDQPWMVIFLPFFGLIIVYARLDSILTHKVAILMVIPVVFSSRYYSKRLTIVTAVVSSLAFLMSAAWGATRGMVNINIVTFPAAPQMVATGGAMSCIVS